MERKIEYVDLGLKSGTLWSDCYISKRYNFSTITNLPEEQYRCYSKFLPTLEDFKELYESCTIKQYQKGNYDIYLIIGPNGNKIRMIRGVASKKYYLVYDYVLYWLKDGFFENKMKLPRTFLSTQLNYCPGDKFKTSTEQYANLIFVKRDEDKTK